MVQILKSSRNEFNPENLPDHLNFLKKSRSFPLEDEHRRKLQMMLSKMTKEKIKETIEKLHHMEYECLDEKAKIQWEKITKRVELYKGTDKEGKAFHELTVPLAPELKDDMKMAVWCRFCRRFAEEYLQSLEAQKIV